LLSDSVVNVSWISRALTPYIRLYGFQIDVAWERLTSRTWMTVYGVIDQIEG